MLAYINTFHGNYLKVSLKTKVTIAKCEIIFNIKCVSCYVIID